MCEGDRFDKLIRRAFQTCDELAFKVGVVKGWPEPYASPSHCIPC